VSRIPIVGDAYIEIRALTNKFNSDIEKSLQKSLNGTGKKLGRETGNDFAEEYRKTVDAKLKKLVKLPGLDNSDAIDSMRALGDEVDRTNKKVKNGRGGFSNLAKSIKGVDDALLTAFTGIITFGGGFSGLIMTFDSVAVAIGAVLGTIGALVSGLFAMSTEIARASKAVGILPGLLTAIITPAVAATLALGGVGKAYAAGGSSLDGLKQGTEEYNEALKKYRAELKKLSPQQAGFVEHLLEHRGALLEVKKAAGEKIFDGLNRALDRIVHNGFLDILGDGLRDAGGALGDVADRIAQLTGEKFFQKSFSNVMDSNVVIIEDLGEAFRNLAGFFVLVADAARPFTEEFSAWIETVTGNWLERARNNFLGLRNSIGDGVGVAKQLGDTFGTIWDTLKNISRAARPAGQRLLEAFSGALDRFDRWTGSKKGQKRMREFFDDIAVTTEAIGSVFVVLVQEMGKLGANPELADMLNTLADSTIPKLFAAMDTLVSHVGPDFIGIFDTMAEIGNVMAEEGGLESFLEVMQGFLDVIKGILEIPGFAKLAGQLLAITASVKALSLIGKFTGIQWLVTTGLPGLIGDKDSGAKGAARALGRLVLPLALIAAASAALNDAVSKTDFGKFVGVDSVGERVQKWIDLFTDFSGIVDTFKEDGFFAGMERLPIIGDFNLKGAYEAGQNAGRSLVRGIADTIGGIKIVVGNIFQGIKNTVVNIVQGIVTTVGDIFGGIVIVFGNIWDGVVRVAKIAFVTIATVFVLLWAGVSAVWEKTGAPVFRAIGRAGSAAWRWLKDKVFSPIKRGWDNLVEKFNSAKRAIGRAWDAIVRAGRTAAEWIQDRIVRPIRAAIQTVADKFNEIKQRIQNAWNLIVFVGSAALRALRNKVFGPVRKATGEVGDKFGGLRRTVANVWDRIKSAGSSALGFLRNKVFSPLKTAVSAIGDAFAAVKRAVTKSWNGLKAAVAGPVNFVIEEVYNKGIRSTWNTIASSVGLKDKLPHVDKVGGGNMRTRNGNQAGPGGGGGFATGGWTGPGSKYQPAGVVHADEFVIKKESRKRIESRLPGLLDHMNLRGSLPGFAGGGLVNAAKWWQAQGARASEHPAFGGVRGGHMKGSLHYSGNAVDLNYGPSGENSTEKAFFDRFLGQFRSKFPDISVLWRVADHFNHMHIDTGGYSSVGKGGGGGGGPLAGAIQSILGLKKKLGSLKDNPLGDLMKGFGSKIIGFPVKFLKDKLASLGEGAGDIIGKIFGGGGKAQDQVRKVASTRGWGDGAQWDALNWIINKESSWNPKAANPTSSARGLFQKMTSVHGPVESTPAGQAEWGLKYIAGRYGNPINAKKFHQSHNWYAGGGKVRPINYAGVFDTGGTLDPGLNLVDNRLGHKESLVRPEMSSPKGLVAEYRKLIQVIERAFGASGKMSSAGAQVVSGLIKGMRSGSVSVADAAISVSNAAIEATRSTLGIQSPSKVFRGFGLNIVKGLVNGIRGGREDLTKVLADTIDHISSYAEDRVDTLSDSILEGVRRANKKITEYNKTHKDNKNLITPPTRKQAEEMAKKRLGYDEAAIAKVNGLIRAAARRTQKAWEDGAGKGTNRILRAVRNLPGSAALAKKFSLGDLARGAEVLTSRLTRAVEKLKAIRESHRDLSSGIAESISGTLDLSSTERATTPTKAVTIKTVSANITTLLGKAKDLAVKFKALIKSGMPKAFVQQIAGLGIDEALSVSNAILAGTKSERKTLYADFKKVDIGAATVGNIVADQMYKVGISAQQGIVRGLERDNKTIAVAAKKLARRLRDAVKKELGIKSPSRVFAALGKFLPLGLVVGIEESTSAAVAAVSKLSGAMTDAFAPDLTTDASISGSALVNGSRRTTTSAAAEPVGSDGLTDRDRAIIAAIEAIGGREGIVINPPAEMDIFTLAKLVSRELQFRGM
jgi:hypothetical protein